MADDDDWWGRLDGSAEDGAPPAGLETQAEPRLMLVSIDDLVETHRILTERLWGPLRILTHAVAEAGLLDRDALSTALKSLSSDPEGILEAYMKETRKEPEPPRKPKGLPPWCRGVIEGGRAGEPRDHAADWARFKAGGKRPRPPWLVAVIEGGKSEASKGADGDAAAEDTAPPNGRPDGEEV